MSEIRVDRIRSESGSGSVDFPNGVTVAGVVTATVLNQTVNGITTFTNANFSEGFNVTGILTATQFNGTFDGTFSGDGSALTGTGSTVFIDNSTDQDFFPLFTATTSGTILSSGISTSKLTYNPSSGEMTAVNFNSTSDENLKTNVHTVENALDIVEKLRGVSFDWKENNKSSYGVIAQELEKVLPELVTGTDQKSVNYNGIIGVLIEAIKELSNKVK